MGHDRQPLSKLCGLWQNESKAGNVYFVGRIGDLKILIFENRDHVEGDSEPTHCLLTQHSPRDRGAS